MTRSLRAARGWLLVAASLLLLSGQQVAAQQRAQARAGDSEHRPLHNLVISADGAWLAAEERADLGVGNVRVWSTERDVTFTIERGQNPRISRDSRWLSALLQPRVEDSRTAKAKDQRAGQTLVVLDLQDGSRRTFDFVLSYDMTYASTYLLYLQSPATKPAATERMMGTLHQIPLDPVGFARAHPGFQHPEATYTHENVVEFVTHPESHHFAYVWRDEETGRDTLQICKWGRRAWYSGDRIEGLRWGRDPGDGNSAELPTDFITLAFLVSTETTAEDGERRLDGALYTWKPGQSADETFTRVDAP